MIESQDLRPGLTIEYEGVLHTVVDVQHIKLARGSAVIKVKLRNYDTGAIFEQSLRSGDKHPVARIERVKAQYLYGDGHHHHLMDTSTYEQHALTDELLGNALSYLKEGESLDLLMYEGKAIGVELPFNVTLRVVSTEPAVRGDTVSGVTKSAKLETGAEVQVPLFVSEGDMVKVDTRNGQYLERSTA
ncbi:MAG: elongation factor P [Candidatus Dormibacteria bacterium]